MSESPVSPATLDVRQIMQIIPHRYPFLMVDRVVQIDLEEMPLVAVKNVTMNEPFFTGHYPGLPIMPGVLMVEAMAQAACIFLLVRPENKGKVPFFAGIDECRFRRQVVPGDQLRIECNVLRMKSRIARCQVTCTVDGQIAAEAQLTCMLGEGE